MAHQESVVTAMPYMMEQRLLDNIARHALLRPGAPVIVAVSGGADSVALLAGLLAIGHTCVAAHCNVHMRGAESDRDMRHVQTLCASLGADLYVRDFDVEARCRATGESVEMACRALRYEWFGALLDKLRAQAIAVGHHREDNVETFFLNLMRGSSLTGLTGMRWRNGYVVRPLLDVSRRDIEDYLAARGLDYVTDSSNAENVYRRNKLRNVVLPALAAEFPEGTDGILRSIGFLGENRDLYDTLVREKAALYHTGDVIHLDELTREQAASARMLLFEMLRPMGFNMSQTEDILASASKSGLTFSAGKTTLELSHGKLAVGGRRRYTADEVEVSLRRDVLTPVNIAVTDLPVTAFKPARNPSIAYFDASILDGDPRFALRRWRRGDRFAPYGMRGTRLLSDVFSDAKLTPAAKRDVWVLTRDGEIIWVVGLRASSRFAVTPSTRRYLQLTLQG